MRLASCTTRAAIRLHVPPLQTNHRAPRHIEQKPVVLPHLRLHGRFGRASWSRGLRFVGHKLHQHQFGRLTPVEGVVARNLDIRPRPVSAPHAASPSLLPSQRQPKKGRCEAWKACIAHVRKPPSPRRPKARGRRSPRHSREETTKYWSAACRGDGGKGVLGAPALSEAARRYCGRLSASSAWFSASS